MPVRLRPTSGPDAPFGSRLLGRPDDPAEKVALRVQLLLTATVLLTNLLGAVAVAAIASLLTPGIDALQDEDTVLRNLIAVPVYVGFALLVGAVRGTRRIRPRLQWVLDGRTPSPEEQRAALRTPLELAKLQLGLWGLATVGFTLLNGFGGGFHLASKVGWTVAVGGTVVCSVAYLLSEFAMRPIAARALAVGPPTDLLVPGVLPRALLAWGLGFLPVLGLMGVAVSAIIRDDVSPTRLSVTILTLGGAALGVGFLLAVLAARATVDPIQGLRSALTRLGEGDLAVEVPVYDATEVGLLQAGFNRTVAGLQERERMRELFGRHVGEDVARAALARDAPLGGEVRDVAALFVDVIGSTSLAAQREPQEVVRILNGFFAVVIDVVARHGGFVNKFEGDGALAVFGAPSDLADPAAAALAAARELAACLERQVTDCTAAVGVAAGPAVAGNIGAVERYEYTVIGDPVNEAARLCELAKELPGHVAASARAVAAAGLEGAQWTTVDEVVLRGRSEATGVAVPADRARATRSGTARRPRGSARR